MTDPGHHREAGQAPGIAAGAVAVAALDAAQLQTVLDALDDGADYRQQHGPASCADCHTADPNRCADHDRDNDLSRRYGALSRQLRQQAR
jgi:mono/diheme cytochrome c family protein